MMMERQRHRRTVSFLSLFLAIDDEMVTTIIIAPFFSRTSIVIEKKNVNAIYIIILIIVFEFSLEKNASSHLHGLHIFYRFFHRTGHVGDRNRSLYY